MRPQNVLISHILLGSVHAVALPGSDHAILSRDDSNSSNSSDEPTIKWTECDLDFGEEGNAKFDALPETPECAKVTVPLDYTSLSSGETIELQLMKVSANKEPKKGSVMYNRGGPGGSGVEAIVEYGLELRDIVGGHYDVIGFDPRGTGMTIPFACNITAPEGTAPTRRDTSTILTSDTWEYVRTALFDSAEATAEACFRDQAKYGRFVGTPFVARDMISIADALGEGPKVNYWGTSYGTVLGQVFASMFPERVGRLVLDANLPADDYASTTWMTGQADTERSLRNVFNECIKAGPEACVLADYAGDDTTEDDLVDALNGYFEGTLNGTYDAALNITTDVERHLGVAFFKFFLVQELYRPALFPNVVSRVNGALTGNLTAALNPPPPQFSTPWSTVATNALHGIACGDSSFRVENRDDLYSIYRTHLDASSFGDAMMTARLTCSRWKFEAAEKIDLNKLRNVRTSFPVLVVNGNYDPVTPVVNAFEVSARFRNSRVLIHYGHGHGLRSHPSKCTFDAMSEYFTDGKLPEVGTTCQPDKSGWEYSEELKKKAEESN